MREIYEEYFDLNLRDLDDNFYSWDIEKSCVVLPFEDVRAKRNYFWSDCESHQIYKSIMRVADVKFPRQELLRKCFVLRNLRAEYQMSIGLHAIDELQRLETGESFFESKNIVGIAQEACVYKKEIDGSDVRLQEPRSSKQIKEEIEELEREIDSFALQYDVRKIEKWRYEHV